MISLNVINGAQQILWYHQAKLITRFSEGLVGIEMGIGYGGGLELLGSLWKGRGEVYGFDTFEDLHPDFLAKEKYGAEARCMDHWYNPDVFGTDALSYEWMRKTLDTEHLTNVHLVRGLVHKESCRDIPKIHYALLDMDIEASMRNGWDAIKDKIVPGGYVFIHDALPENHLPAVHKWWFNEVLPSSPEYEVVGHWPNQFLTGVVRKGFEGEDKKEVINQSP